jgi:hypothetical protein
MGVFSSYTGKIFFPNWRIFFPSWRKKKRNLANLHFLQPPHTHTRTYTCVKRMGSFFRTTFHLNLYSPRPLFTSCPLFSIRFNSESSVLAGIPYCSPA